MTKNELFAGASVIISIKVTYEVRDESGLIPIEQTPGELVLTEKEFVFLEVKGMIRKEKKRLHAFSVDHLMGYSYERWDGGDTSLYLTLENETGDRKNYLYICSKRDYEKFIGKVKGRRLI